MNYGKIKSTWASVELNLLLHALILVKSGCFTNRETLLTVFSDNLVVEYENFLLWCIGYCGEFIYSAGKLLSLQAMIAYIIFTVTYHFHYCVTTVI